MSLFVCFTLLVAASVELCDCQEKQAILHVNPYTSWRRPNASQPLETSSSDLEYQYVNSSTVRRLPQWAKVRRHHILVGYGRRPPSVESDAGAATPNRSQYERMLHDQQQVSQSEINIQQVLQDAPPSQESSVAHYNCDSIIRDPAFVVESPHYPSHYPVNRICTYYIAKYSHDICQIEVTISDMDIEDTPQCTSDYLDLSGGTAGGGVDQRLCGLMLRNTQRLIVFPSNGSYIRFTFHSDGHNAQPHRGFSAQVRQLPNSCAMPRLYPNGSNDYNPLAATQSPLAGIYPGYGQRLYPTTQPPYILRPVNPGRKDANFPLPTYRSVNQFPIGPTIYPSNFSGRGMHDNSPIYLESYCDIYLSEFNGELRSPSYPFGYPPNHTCIYTIKRAAPDVCQVEVTFHHFDIQTGGNKKDLTENCEGDYLEMPDHRRLCGYYNQAMSKDHLFKKFYFFRDTTNYLFLQFVSDNHPSPDGSGFWIEVKQLRNTCPSNFDSHKVNCDRVITAQYSSTERVYSPNYPSFYNSLQQCVYFIQPGDDTTCEFELDLVQFDLEANKDQDYGCTKDYLQLPDRTRICGRTLFRRMFSFPRYHKRTSMFYFQSDKNIENRGYEIIVRQFPNTCNHTGNSGWNPNAQLDPNIRSPVPGFGSNPTPVFTFSNSSGFQPYLPPSLSPGLPSSKAYGFPFGTKKNVAANLPPFLVQDLLNNPRNVDSSGTIPLYFANGTLAARIPPLKPIDLIPYLKKGKTFAQKAGNVLPVNDPRNLYATVTSTNNLNDILTNRFPTSHSNNEAEVFDSSAKLREFSPRSGFGPRSDSVPRVQLQPTYSCDQVVNRNIEYIRSPNFPNNYPTVTRCIYSIIKSDISVCQVRLNILSLDLEYTNGCRNDYFLIETTGEKLCGRFSAPETRVINYYGFSRDIRLIFNSDRQTTSAGFEVRVEQVPNSCDDGNNRTSSNSQAGLPAGRALVEPIRAGRLMHSNASPSAQALVVPNGLNSTINNLGTSSRICRTTAVMETIFESQNFPMPYPGGTDCLYKIFRANRNVCRLEIEFLNFNVGSAQMETSRAEASRMVQQQTIESSVANCLNDFVEIDSIRYCGNREGDRLAINFPRMMSEVSMRFVTFGSDRFSGFRIKVNQIDRNCRSSMSGLLTTSDESTMSDFSPATIESCAKISESSKESANINEEVVRVHSPKFGLVSPQGYESFLDCDYVVSKASRDVCALELRFERFALEESRSCSKDYFEINNNGMRLCGTLGPNVVRTFDFPNDVMRLHFHSDGDRNDAGFAIILRQIRC